MIDDLELQYFDIEQPIATPEAYEFARKIVQWKVNKLQMLPDDVLNYMIQENLITEQEVIGLLIESFLLKNSLDISLPKRYNI